MSLLKRIKVSSLKDGIIKKSICEAQGKVTVDDALQYFTKSELFFLFVVPFTFASAYIVAMWTLFKYICDIRDIEHFIRTARWLNGKEPYPFEYLREGRRTKSLEGVAIHPCRRSTIQLRRYTLRYYIHIRYTDTRYAIISIYATPIHPFFPPSAEQIDHLGREEVRVVHSEKI